MAEPKPDTSSIAFAGHAPPIRERMLERKIARARARVVERLHELGRRVEKAKDAINVAQLIRRHPLTAIGVGLAAGAMAALPRGSKGDGFSRRLGALITGIALQVVKSRLDAWIAERLVPDTNSAR